MRPVLTPSLVHRPGDACVPVGGVRVVTALLDFRGTLGVSLRIIARELVKAAKSNAGADWWRLEPVRARMRVTIKHILRQKGYPPGATQQAIRNVIAQAVPFPRTVMPMRIACVAGGPAWDRRPDARACWWSPSHTDRHGSQK